MADFPIIEGYFLLGGRSKENARKAISEAQERGFGADAVLTRQDGYLIPLADGEVTELVGEPIETPDKSWKNEDIINFAEEQEIDLGEAATKAEMLAVIDEAFVVMGAADADENIEEEEEGE